MIEEYIYPDSSLSIHKNVPNYDETVLEIMDNLSDHSMRDISVEVEQILHDDQLEISSDYLSGDNGIKPERKYISGEAAVYIFEAPDALELVGSKPMIDMSLPEEYPSIYQ